MAASSMPATAKPSTPSSAQGQAKRHESTKQITLLTLPDDVLITIFSFLPTLESDATCLDLKRAYEDLALVRAHPYFIDHCRPQTQSVTTIDPFPHITIPGSVILPPHAKPGFLAFLVKICPNLATLRAPSLKGVLQHCGHNLRTLRTVDTGLTEADLVTLSKSSLTEVRIVDPSTATLTALAQVKTLNIVSLLHISENLIPNVLEFLAWTSTKVFAARVETTSVGPLLSILQGLPKLDAFILDCHVHQLWTLPYLRRIAVQIDKVEMIIAGTKIRVRPIEESFPTCTRWDNFVIRHLICKKGFGQNEIEDLWPVEMRMKEIDFEVWDDAERQGLQEQDINNLLRDYANSDLPQDEGGRVKLKFGRTLPTSKTVEDRVNRMSVTGICDFVTYLVISQDVVLYAWKDQEWLTHVLKGMFGVFSKLHALHLCRPSSKRTVSARFVMALPKFLEIVVDQCGSLRCVYMEDAGELVLHKGSSNGMPFLTNQDKLVDVMNQVVWEIVKLEALERIELGTVIAQLELWRNGKLRSVDGNELDDVSFLNDERRFEAVLRTDPDWVAWFG